MTSVLIGLLALGAGPLLAPVLRRHLGVASAVDGFILVSVCGLVVLQVVPQSVGIVGPSAIAWLAVGMVTPVFLHRFDRRAPPGAARARTISAGVVVGVGLFVHAVLDGVALVHVGDVGDAVGGHAAHAAGHDHHDSEGMSSLALAVILHRVPTSLAIWVMGRDRFGTAGAVGLLLSLAAGTLVGAANVAAFVDDGSVGLGTLAAMQAFAAGAVMHVLIDAPTLDVTPYRRASAIGAALAAAALIALTQTHPVLRLAEDELHFSQTLLTLVAEAGPGLVVAVAVVALLRRRQRPIIIGAGTTGLSRALSGVRGALLAPQCTCSAGPAVEQTLRRRGAPSAVAAFLAASPAFYVPTVALAAVLLGGVFSVAVVGGMIIIAVTVGIVVNRGAKVDDDSAGAAIDVDGAGGPWAVIDHVGPWLLAGFALAAICEPLMQNGLMHVDSAAIELPLAAVLGVPFYACGVAAVPLVAVLVHKGLSLGAAATFLAAAPILNVAVMSRLRPHVSRAVVVGGAVVAAIGAVALGVVVNAAVAHGVIAPPSLHHDADHAHDIVELVAMVVCAGAVLGALWRQGARGFLGQIVGPLDEALGGHVHGPHCGHRGHAGPGFMKRSPVARVKLDWVPPA